jgi:hypothetical protein
MKEEEKLKVIWAIDKAIDKLRGTAYYKDLNMLRKKYIYKDISPDEFTKDVKYLRTIKRIIVQ